MNALVALCHFCELHGPSVLFTTQAFHDNAELQVENDGVFPGSKKELKKCYGNVDNLKTRIKFPRLNSCEACQSLTADQLGFISNDHEGRISYLSTQEATEHDVSELLRQACFRSLSCEVSPGKEGPLYFGDDIRGHVLSYTFFLKDAQARGFHRWFSVVILMRDKLFLLNSWPFLVDNLNLIISGLQTKASKLYEMEQAQCPQRAFRLSPESSAYKQLSNKPSRSLTELSSDENIFAKLHWWFTWLLRAGAERLVEKVSEGLPGQATTIEWDKFHYEVADMEEGFTLVSAKERHCPVQELEASGEVLSHKPAISNVRQLREILGRQQFIILAFCFMTGHQIVVRGQPQELVSSIIRCLKVLVPRSCYRAVLQSEEYMDTSHCNILGLNPWAAAPQPSSAIARLDILPPLDKTDTYELQKYNYKLTWGGKLPSKCPTVLTKMEKALDNPKLADTVLQYHFVALKEEWLNIAKVLKQVHQPIGQFQDMSNLLHALGAQEQDKALLTFWAAGVLS
ncbi:hypothetical protein R5R35_003021 [Gryllus longicercus]|uniref:Folliculin n=1 Tax=Gryllus longicercus TaxID=2509291 RepID=A0AAN9VU49_9ORTH